MAESDGRQPGNPRSDDGCLRRLAVPVADTVDAPTASRPDRPELLPTEETFAQTRRVAGYRLDPDLVEAFIRDHRSRG